MEVACMHGRMDSERALAVQRTYVYGGVLSATHLFHGGVDTHVGLWWRGVSFARWPARNVLWSCVAMTLRSLGAWRARRHGCL